MEKIIHCELPGEYYNNAFTDEPIIKVPESDRIIVEMQYPLLKMDHAVSTCYLRKGAAERLAAASKLLPDGLRFKIWDGWRPFLLQKELYTKYREEIIRSHHLDENDPDTERIVRGFVSVPLENPDDPPVHTTGGAVDLTLCDENGTDLNMGTCFDSFSKSTYTDYYEEHEEPEVRNNRRILYHVMTEAGFTNLPSEWWHYDFGDKFWGYYKKTNTLYRGVFEEGFS